MRKLTQLQYEVIFLYAKGLKFREIDKTLTTASRGVYSQIVAKDKSRVTRAKNSRKTNLNNYKRDLKIFLDEVKQNNRYLSHFSSSSRYIVSLNLAEESFRIEYINKSLDKANKSYSKYRLTFLKNHLKVA